MDGSQGSSRRAVVLFMGLLSLACTTTATQPTAATAAADGGPTANVSDRIKCFVDACPVGLDCLGGLCYAPTDTTCTLSNQGNDGCDAQSICASGPTGTRCYVAPPCDGLTCPAGAMCNEDVLADKGRLCIPDRCIRDANCRSSKRCLLRKTDDIIGHCVETSRVAAVGSRGNASEGHGAGCPTDPLDLQGSKAAGAACVSPYECKPICCACDSGRTSILAAMCDFNRPTTIGGTCVSAQEACTMAPNGTNCYPP